MRILLLLFVLLIAGCSFQQELKTETRIPVTANQDIVVIADNLQIPWSIDKYGDVFYLSERGGTIVKMENGEVTRQQVELDQQLATASEAGLLGFVLARDFPSSKIAYAYYTYVESAGQYNRVVTLRLEGERWKEETVLLDQIPSGRVHHGGRLEIGPDGKLYVTVGDASERNLAQNKDSLAGKMLRLNLDGSIPVDNPISGSYVYSYSHRNPQGMTWTVDGTMYASEHGNQANDEINQIQAGGNYGWPIIEGNEQQQGMISPIFTSGNDETWAPSGMAVYNGKLYIAALRGEAVLEFNLATGDKRKVITGLGRIRDVFIEGDSLYFISNNTDGRGITQPNDDKLYRASLLQWNE